MYLEGDDLLTVGAYFLVAGTFISAIGETMKPDVNNVNKKINTGRKRCSGGWQ